ncbi:NAF1 [Branchiostoma lanceolatum]|uniref:H/ACA ribonucleoprotein complex subunit n=1 Tax=Branchiostoma lanceolatum TaxID=7740 RepID=A0A8J9Z341_BRALA|nr:NAF1 [Branchiostoma lanceolatum]
MKKEDALKESKLTTETNTQQDSPTNTLKTEDMETDNPDAAQGFPVKEEDVIDSKEAVELQQEEGENLQGSKDVAESSDSESTSSDESESSSDSSDEEEEEEVKNDKPKKDQPLPAKEDVVPQVTEDAPVENFPDIILPEDVQVKAIGKISCIIGQLVVVQSYPNTPALDAETLLFNSGRQSIGLVNDTFGPVVQPCYSIQFSSAKKIEAVGLNLQNEIFFAPEVQDFTVYVFTQSLIKQKGSDASWKNDQEPPAECLDYSDDEQEKVAKKSLKEAKGKKPKPRKAFKR